VLVQSRTIPDWDGIGVKGWLATADSPIDLKSRLKLDALTAGQRFRVRLRANPCVTRNGKRLGLLQLVEQEQWIKRKGLLHGFVLPEFPAFNLSEDGEARIDIQVSQDRMLSGLQHHGNKIRIFSVLYDGVMTVTDASAFVKVLQMGIGHGKALGLGLLSVAPIA
jgi:CRISPR system Cascade subunit CasE